MSTVADLSSSLKNIFYFNLPVFGFDRAGQLKKIEEDTFQVFSSRIGRYDFNDKELEEEYVYLSSLHKERGSIKILEEVSDLDSRIDKLRSDIKIRSENIKEFLGKYSGAFSVWYRFYENDTKMLINKNLSTEKLNNRIEEARKIAISSLVSFHGIKKSKDYKEKRREITQFIQTLDSLKANLCELKFFDKIDKLTEKVNEADKNKKIAQQKSGIFFPYISNLKTSEIVGVVAPLALYCLGGVRNPYLLLGSSVGALYGLGTRLITQRSSTVSVGHSNPRVGGF